MLKTLLPFSLLVACFGLFETAAQLPQPAQDIVDRNVPNPLLKSPNVAALGKFGDYPVSHYTGLPEISIPILEATSGELKVAISLSYHASGVKPTDPDGWVGTGWSLTGGGQISRSIQGKPDEEHYAVTELKADLSNCDYPEGAGTFYYLQYAARGVTDTEPDIFSYSYPGGRGKFLLPYNEDPYLVPYRPIKLQRFPGKFELVDEKGILYRFGTDSQGNSAIESSASYYGGIPSAQGVTAWHLTEIVSPNSDDRIWFTFQNAGTKIMSDIAHTYTIIDLCDNEDGDGQCPSTVFTPQIKEVWTSVPQVVFSTIYFEGGKAEFVLGSSPFQGSLDYINIYSLVHGIYVKKKTVQFVYTYFKDADGEDSKLKLDALQFKDSENNVVQEYRFTYWTDSFSWGPGFWNARDLWGYYNGATQNTDMVLRRSISYQPTTVSQQTFVDIGGAIDRNVNPSFIKEGALRSISFPTGGYTEFDYEPNMYMDNSVTLAGGLRVKTIVTRDGPNAVPIIKTYKYGIDECGYGLPNFNTHQFNISTDQYYYSSHCHYSNDPSVYYRIRTYHSSSSYTLDPFSSAPVRYSEVAEYIGDPTGRRLGKIIYEYNNVGDTDHFVPKSGKYYRNSHFWKRGHLLGKTVYDSLDQKVAETRVQYTEYNTSTNKYVGLGVHEAIAGNSACYPPGLCYNEADEPISPVTHMYTKYFQDTGVLLETQIKEYFYEPGSPTKYTLTQTDKLYESVKTQLKQVTVNRSTGEQRVTVNTYPFELAANGASTGTAKGIYKLTQKNIIASPIESFTYLLQGSSDKIISGQITTFHECPENVDYVVPDRLYFWESDLPILKSSYTPISINSGNNGIVMDSFYKERMRLAYDNTGNIQTVTKTNDNSITYLWGYDNSRPVAQIVNAEMSEVAYSSFESDGKGNWAYSGSTANTMTAKTGEFYYPLSGGSITRQLPAGKYKLEYWAKGSANISGGTITTIRTSSADNNGWILYEKEVVMTGTTTLTVSGGAGAYVDELRVYPVDAQMTTYTYDPLNGITSVTDPSNFTTYYEYDDFGRLKFVKDKDGYVQKMNEYNYRFK